MYNERHYVTTDHLAGLLAKSLKTRDFTTVSEARRSISGSGMNSMHFHTTAMFRRPNGDLFQVRSTSESDVMWDQPLVTTSISVRTGSDANGNDFFDCANDEGQLSLSLAAKAAYEAAANKTSWIQRLIGR